MFRGARGEAQGIERTALRELLSSPLPAEARAPGRFTPGPRDIELGFRLLPVVLSLRAADRAGLLYRLTTAITGEGLDVTSALIETLGADAVDCFYVCNPSGSPVEPEQRRRVDDALASATLGAGADERARADTPGRFR